MINEIYIISKISRKGHTVRYKSTSELFQILFFFFIFYLSTVKHLYWASVYFDTISDLGKDCQYKTLPMFNFHVYNVAYICKYKYTKIKKKK